MGAAGVTARSMVRVALVIFVVLMVQQTVMVALRVGGAHPDLLWLLPITRRAARRARDGGHRRVLGRAGLRPGAPDAVRAVGPGGMPAGLRHRVR